MNKQPPFFSKFYLIYNKGRKHLKQLSGYIYEFPVKQVHQCDKNQNRHHLYKSDLDVGPIHKFFRVTISSIKYIKNSNSDIISLHVYNRPPYKITLALGLLGYRETNATTSPTKEVECRVSNIFKKIDLCQSTILDEELSIKTIISNEKRNTDYFKKKLFFTPYRRTTKILDNVQFLTLSNNTERI